LAEYEEKSKQMTIGTLKDVEWGIMQGKNGVLMVELEEV
jgi:hypothetical protein